MNKIELNKMGTTARLATKNEQRHIRSAINRKMTPGSNDNDTSCCVKQSYIQPLRGMKSMNDVML
jgi:hypothetical protein